MFNTHLGHQMVSNQLGMAYAALWRYRIGAIMAVLLLASLVGVRTVQSSTIPTISIVSVKADESVTIRTHDFPAGYTFAVTMGYMGTAGIGGTFVTTTASGGGGSFDMTYPIPEGLHGQPQIAIRLQTEHLSPYYAFNWFYNNTAPTAPITSIGQGGEGSALVATPGYTGIPTFKITAVEQDKSVTIETNNFPANQNFELTMGVFGTQGIGGTAVATFNSEGGGTLTKTFEIPAAYHGHSRIAIRAQTAHVYPYYAYNWFFNNSTAGALTGSTQPAETGTGNVAPPQVASPVAPPFEGMPTFKVCGVAQNSTVTIVTSKLPANQTFYVTMGAMYAQGIGGINSGSFLSGDGSEQRLTFNIPAEMQGAYRIAMRFQTTHPEPYFAYNWFYNNTATVC